MAENKTKTGLIVVDLQRAFLPPDSLVAGIREILPRYDIVVATQFLNYPGSLYEIKKNYRECHIGSRESEIVIPLSPAAVFDRFSYGLQQPHIEKLKSFPVQVWDICGCDTEACVLATCYNLWDNRIEFRVLTEFCSSSGGEELQEAATKIIYRSFEKKRPKR